jgi:hypothetical protein
VPLIYKDIFKHCITRETNDFTGKIWSRNGNVHRITEDVFNSSNPHVKTYLSMYFLGNEDEGKNLRVQSQLCLM